MSNKTSAQILREWMDRVNETAIGTISPEEAKEQFGNQYAFQEEYISSKYGGACASLEMRRGFTTITEVAKTDNEGTYCCACTDRAVTVFEITAPDPSVTWIYSNSKDKLAEVRDWLLQFQCITKESPAQMIAKFHKRNDKNGFKIGDKVIRPGSFSTGIIADYVPEKDGYIVRLQDGHTEFWRRLDRVQPIQKGKYEL